MLHYVDRSYCELSMPPVQRGFVDPVYRLKHLVAATLSGGETPDWIVDSEYPPITPLSSMSGNRTRTRRAGGVREDRPERRVQTSTLEYFGREVRRVEAEMRVPTWIVQYKRGLVPLEDYVYVRDPSVRSFGGYQP